MLENVHHNVPLVKSFWEGQAWIYVVTRIAICSRSCGHARQWCAKTYGMCSAMIHMHLVHSYGVSHRESASGESTSHPKVAMLVRVFTCECSYCMSTVLLKNKIQKTALLGRWSWWSPERLSCYYEHCILHPWLDNWTHCLRLEDKYRLCSLGAR